MPAPKRRIDPGVIEQLLDTPYRFGFFQAVRVLEQWFAKQNDREHGKAAREDKDEGNGRGKDEGKDEDIEDHGFETGDATEHALSSVADTHAHGSGERSERDRHQLHDIVAYQLSFRNTLSLAFPPSEIEKLRAYDASGEWLEAAAVREQALRSDGVAHIALTPSFFGLLGVQGALPLHYTEQIAEREVYNRDHAARAYLDIFSNRATALFYRAWKKYRLAFHYELDRDERYMPYLLALAGIDRPAQESLQRDAGKHFDEAMAGYASAIRQKPMSATYLQRVLADYFNVPIRVEQFVGKWYAVPPTQFTQLGQKNAMLGATALVGERVWLRDMCIRLVVGPLTIKQYRAFLRGAENAAALAKFLQLAAGVSLECDVCPVLRRQDVASSRLGMSGRLGQDAFLTTRAALHDRRDARYALQLIP